MQTDTKRFLPRLSAAAGLAALLLGAGSVSATVVYSDDFEDGDKDNLGFAVSDVDVNIDGVIGTWSSTNASFPDPIAEVTDPGLPTSGIRWHANGGFTNNGSGDPKSYPVILNDTPFNISTNPSGLPDSVNFNTGLALGIQGKGRSTTTTGFFDPTPTVGVANDQRLTLGLNVGDEVKVSFDWRVWESNPATAHNPVLPDLAQLRFGLYQDTDHELGTAVNFAGLNAGSAVWGQEDGLFNGQLAAAGGAGANGDHGWFAKLFIGDEDYTLFEPDPINEPGVFEPIFTGDLNRIVEETNPGTSADARLMGGSDQITHASPPDGTVGDPSSFFPLLKHGKLYNIEFSLVRSVAAAFQGDSAGLITATVTVNELDAGGSVIGSWSFGDEANGSVQSDVWDYIAFRNSSGDPEQDYDMIIDNLLIEECGGGCGAVILEGDLNGDGFVGIADLNIVLGLWNQNVTPGDPLQGDPTGDGFVGIADLNLVLGNWNAGTPPTGNASIPEPGTLALLGLGAGAMLKRRK